MSRRTNKKRKLAYIREKNTLRSGAVIYFDIKVSAQIICDDNSYEGKFILDERDSLIERMTKKYKRKFIFKDVSLGRVQGDFELNLWTLRFALKVSYE